MKSRTTPKASGFDLQEQRRARTQGTAEVVHGNNGSDKRGRGHGRAGAWGAGGCLSKEKGATGWPGGQGGRRVHGRRRRATKQQRRGRRAMVTGRRCRGGSETPEADDGGAALVKAEAMVEERVSGDEAQQRQRPWRTAALRREWPLGSASSWRKRRSCRGGVWRRLLDACGAGRSGAGTAGRGASLLSLAKQGRRRSRERALRAREREAQVGTTE